MRKPCHFRQRDLSAALKAAQVAGVPVQIKIKDGEMTVTMLDGVKQACERPASTNEWDEVFSEKGRDGGTH